MLNLKKINKNEFGKFLIPTKIFGIKYRKEMIDLHEKIYFDNFNYLIISNIFLISTIVALGVYIFLYPEIYRFFYDWIIDSFFYHIIIIFFTWFLTNLFMYYFFLLGYFFYHDSIFKKTEDEIEQDLPEFIDNLVSNLKGGISLEKALLKSVRPQHKALLREITLVNERLMSGMDVISALRSFRDRFKSPIISRTFFLIEEGIKGGGNLALPLERISQNLKNIYQLDEEIKANSGGFAVVIRMISVFIAPLLFALAITLLTFISNLFSLLSEGDNSLILVSSVPPEFSTYLQNFSYAMIILITFFSSLIVSQLKNEESYKALKYVPLTMAFSIILYIVFSRFLLNFFGNII